LKNIGEVNASTLDNILKTYYCVGYLSTHDKLYQHYLDLGIALDDRFKKLFDYEITNGVDLKAAQEKLLDIVREEILSHRLIYNFLMPRSESDQRQAQKELNQEGNGYQSLPTFDNIKQRLEKAMTPFYVGRGIHPLHYSFMHGPIILSFYGSKDRERSQVAFGSFELQGPKKKLAKTGDLLKELFPELEEYGSRQVRVLD